MAKTIDMTKGSPFKTIFKFAIPIALSFMLQQLYNLGDSFIVSFSRGPDVVTGVNLTGSITFLVLGFAQGLAAGFGIVLSQFVGAKDTEKMKNSLATSIILCAGISVVVSVVATLLARPMLELLKTDKAFIEYSEQYIKTIFIGMGFTVFYNFSDQVMRAMGDSKTPLLILILCAVLNILLNSLLFVTNWGVAWAGWATVISQGVSAVVGFFIIFKKFEVLHLKKKDFKFTFKFALKHFATGLPMAFQFMITAIGCMIQQRAFNVLGEEYQMAQSTASKIDNIFGQVFNAIGSAMATYCGQNYGARRLDRIKQGFIASLGVGAICMIFATGGAIGLSYPLSKLLLSGVDNKVYDHVFRYLLIQSCGYYFLFLVFMPRQALQAMDKGVHAMFGGVIELVMRYATSITLAVWWGYPGACFSNVLAWTGAAIYLVITFIVQYSKEVKKFSKEEVVLAV